MADRGLHAVVHGRVQGVNFRWYTRQRATQLGLTGWVRNLRDGRRVEVVAEGPPDPLNDLVLLLHRGPPGAHVEDVEINWKEATGQFKDFSVWFS